MADLSTYTPWRGDQSPYDSALEPIDDELWARFSQAREQVRDETGVVITVASGYRSTIRQAQLYACYIGRAGPGLCRGGCTSCNLAAVPGTSNHERGLAIDMAPNYDADSRIRPIFAAHGLHFPIAIEHWHVELAPNRGPLNNLPPPPPVEDDVSDQSVIVTTAKHEVEVRLAPAENAALIRWVDRGGLVTANPSWAILFSDKGGLLGQPPVQCQDVKPLFFEGRLHLRLWSTKQGVAVVCGVSNFDDDLTRWDQQWYSA